MSHLRASQAWVLLGGFLITATGAIAKLIGDEVSSLQLTLFRALFGLGLILPAALARHGLSVLRTESLDLYLVRGLVSAAGMTAAFYAVVNLTLATASAVSFTSPSFITLLAWLVLRERVSPYRWVGIGLGFLGVIVVVRPGGDVGGPAAVALVGALAVAAAKLFVKELAARDGPYTILVYLGLVMTAVTALPAALTWQPLTGLQVVALMAIGALSMAAQTCFIHGYKAAQASAVAPFEYARLIYATGFGIVLFGTKPGLYTVGGALIIVAGTLFAPAFEPVAARAKGPNRSHGPNPVRVGRGLSPPVPRTGASVTAGRGGD